MYDAAPYSIFASSSRAHRHASARLSFEPAPENGDLGLVARDDYFQNASRR